MQDTINITLPKKRPSSRPAGTEGRLALATPAKKVLAVPPPEMVTRRCFRFLCWLGSVAAFGVNFYQNWTIPWPGQGIVVRSGPIVLEALALTVLFFIGSLIGGGWWRAMQRGRRIGGTAIFLWSGAAFAGFLSREIFWLGWWLWLLPAAVSWLKNARSHLSATRAFFLEKTSWNGAFFLLWIVVCTGCDAALLRDAPPGVWATLDCLAGRFLNHVFIAATLWLVLQWHDRWASRLGRIVAWSALVLLLYIVVTNALLHVWWAKGWIELLGELEVGGTSSISSSASASGLSFQPVNVLLIVASLLVAAASHAGCRWISRSKKWRISLAQLALIAGVAWTGYQIDQFGGIHLKSRAWRWWEMKSFHLRMTSIKPEQGIANYQVRIANPLPEIRPQQLARKPDIFLIMVETLRADALRPEVAPFLTQWRDTECQPLGESWAASNATHLSWFSILSGRLPVFYEEARQAAAPALLPALLSASGYHVEARLAGDIDYMEMRRTLFGEPPQLAALDYNNAAEIRKKPATPERDLAALEKIRRSVLAREAGGAFFLTSLDSTHFPYEWAADFNPPFDDYAENAIPPLHADAKKVRRILHRYWNAVSWVDRQLAGFIGFLKAQNRYDNAIIVIIGDHGEEFREYGSWFHCSSLNAAQTRVPILIKWPQAMGIGRGPGVRQSSHLDLVPTLLDALGVEKNLWQSLPGRSLLRPGEGTTVLATNYAGKNGEAMVLRRAGREAAFGWQNYWESTVPQQIWLERLEPLDEGGLVSAFPDLQEKIFQTIREESP